MPFETDTLPREVEVLPKEAQAIWLSVFNSTFRTFSGSESEKEEASFIAAWGAVRSRFQKLPDGSWDRKAMLSFDDAVGVKFQSVRFVKFIDDLMQAKDRITLGEVYVPWEVDAQGEFADEETIEKGAYNWMKKYQEIGEQHQLFGGKGVVVENFISRKGDRDFPTPGSWVMGTQWSEDMWEKILNGEVTGYSLGGKWTHVPIVAGREYAKSIHGQKNDAEIGELDMDLFEKPLHEGPRVIWQIVSFDDIEEVSGVGMPAIRKPFKLFKGDRMKPKVRVVGKTKQVPASPCLKLYDNFVASGLSTEEARIKVEETLECPEGWLDSAKQTDGVMSLQECTAQVDGLLGVGKGMGVCSLMQAKYAAGPEGGIALPEGVTLEQAAKEWAAFGEEAGILAQLPEDEEKGILKSIKSAIHSIANHLGVKGAEAQEDEPMTPQEKERIDAIEKSINEVKDLLIAKATAPVADAKCEGGKCGCQSGAAIEDPRKDDEDEKAKAAADSSGAPDLAQINEEILELATAVKGLMDEIAEMKSRPGVSVVEMATVPNGKEFQGAKSAGGYDWSSMLSAPIPAGARDAEVQKAVKRQEKLEQRRAASSRINLRMS